MASLKDHMNEIQQSYGAWILHLIDYTQMQQVHLLFPFVFIMGGVFVLADVSTMEIAGHQIETDEISSKLVCFVKGDGGSGFARR